VTLLTIMEMGSALHGSSGYLSWKQVVAILVLQDVPS
jgi:hypothetical protein